MITAALRSLQVAAHGGDAMALDTSKAYRLTNDTLGSGRSLDGTTRLTTASSDDGPGQRWRLQPQDGGTYGLTTEALGPCGSVRVLARAEASSPVCPGCRAVSRRVHSRYERRLLLWPALRTNVDLGPP